MKSILAETIKRIETKRDNETAVIKDRIVREKIAPYNANIDQLRAKALAEVDTELNEKIIAVKAEYEAKKQEIVRLGEEDKRKNSETILASELATITTKYDNEIAKLQAQIAEIEE